MTATPEPAPATPQRRTPLQNTLVVMLFTLFSRLSGLLRQLIVNLFDNTIMDAFMVAVRVPNLLRELVAEGALVNSFIPVYKSLPEGERRRLAAAFSGTMIAINMVLAAIGIIAAPWVVDLLLAANSNVDREIAIYMTRLAMPFLMLISLASVASGVLTADEHFKESGMAPVAFNVASIAVLLILPPEATWLAIGWLVGGVAQLLVQVPPLMRHGLLPRPTLQGHSELGRVLRNMAPFMLTATTRQVLNVYVSRLLSNAQHFPAGTQGGYANAEALFTMANGLFVISTAQAYFPRFSDLAAAQKWDEFSALMVNATKATVFMAAPASALLLALAPQAAALFNLSGSMPETRLLATVGIVSGWALALVPWGVMTIATRTFYARERSREAVVVSALVFVLEVALYNVLVPRIGFWGFGASTALVGILGSALLYWRHRQSLPLDVFGVLRHAAIVLLLAALAGGAARAVAGLFAMPRQMLEALPVLALAGGVGLLVYFGGAVLLRLPEVNGIVRRLPFLKKKK